MRKYSCQGVFWKGKYGVIRDVLANTMPFILHKHIYAVAALAGGLICALLMEHYMYMAMFLGAGIIIVIRLLASRYCWDLPKPMPGRATVISE